MSCHFPFQSSHSSWSESNAKRGSSGTWVIGNENNFALFNKVTLSQLMLLFGNLGYQKSFMVRLNQCNVKDKILKEKLTAVPNNAFNFLVIAIVGPQISDWPNGFRSTWTYLLKHTKHTPFVKPRGFGQSEIRSIRCLPKVISIYKE